MGSLSGGCQCDCLKLDVDYTRVRNSGGIGKLQLYHGHQGFIAENHLIPRAHAQPEGEVWFSVINPW